MLAVVVRAVRLFAVCPVLALLHFHEIRVVLLLLPSMGIRALVLVGAAFPVRADEVVHLPVRTHLAAVNEGRGAPSVVLPVVSIHTYLPVVVVLAIRTPNSLEEEHVEVHVNIIFFDQLNGQLAFTVGEGAILKIFAWLASRFEIRRTKLGLVLVWMVKLFNAVVGPVTLVSSLAVHSFSSHLRTDFRLVCS